MFPSHRTKQPRRRPNRAIQVSDPPSAAVSVPGVQQCRTDRMSNSMIERSPTEYDTFTGSDRSPRGNRRLSLGRFRLLFLTHSPEYSERPPSEPTEPSKDQNGPPLNDD